MKKSIVTLLPLVASIEEKVAEKTREFASTFTMTDVSAASYCELVAVILI
jgi:hypothetical protein